MEFLALCFVFLLSFFMSCWSTLSHSLLLVTPPVHLPYLICPLTSLYIVQMPEKSRSNPEGRSGADRKYAGRQQRSSFSFRRSSLSNSGSESGSSSSFSSRSRESTRHDSLPSRGSDLSEAESRISQEVQGAIEADRLLRLASRQRGLLKLRHSFVAVFVSLFGEYQDFVRATPLYMARLRHQRQLAGRSIPENGQEESGAETTSDFDNTPLTSPHHPDRQSFGRCHPVVSPSPSSSMTSPSSSISLQSNMTSVDSTRASPPFQPSKPVSSPPSPSKFRLGAVESGTVGENLDEDEAKGTRTHSQHSVLSEALLSQRGESHAEISMNFKEGTPLEVAMALKAASQVCETWEE